VPAVEEYGIEPIPAELRTAGWRDLFAVNFTFFLNPVMYVLGALAVLEGGLPLPWALVAMVLGQALAFALLVVVAQPGVDDGLPGQVAMRATLGILGARLLSSPYRVIAATYWFAAQALTGALGFQAIVDAMSGHRLPLVPTALAMAVFYAVLAVLGFDVMRWLLKVVLPLSLLAAVVLVALFLGSDDPRYDLGRVLDSPEQQLTWVGFATFITVMCGSSLTFVTNVADVCRYTPTRRDLRIGLISSALLSAVVTTFVGGYVAAASGDTNPFVAAASLTSSDVVLVGLLAAIVVQTIAANLTNVYTAGLSLVNSVPRLGRLWATVAAGVISVVLSGFPSFIEEAQTWVTHLGNLAAPLTGVILADYLVVRRGRVDVPALFDPDGRYRFLGGVNVSAVLAIGAGVAVYYALPDASIKVLWGIAVAGCAYLALRAVTARARGPEPERAPSEAASASVAQRR
jgi:NCS1 nucleoside transporter family